jgi:hypothetical protein
MYWHRLPSVSTISAGCGLITRRVMDFCPFRMLIIGALNKIGFSIYFAPIGK